MNSLSILNNDNSVSVFNPSSLDDFFKSIENINDIDDAVDILNNSAYIGRDLWIQTALIAFKVTANSTKKERSEKIKQLGDRLRYAKSQIYNFIDAGGKLLDKENIDKLDKCYSVNDYLKICKPKKEDTNTIDLFVVSNVVKNALVVNDKSFNLVVGYKIPKKDYNDYISSKENKTHTSFLMRRLVEYRLIKTEFEIKTNKEYQIIDKSTLKPLDKNDLITCTILNL